SNRKNSRRGRALRRLGAARGRQRRRDQRQIFNSTIHFPGATRRQKHLADRRGRARAEITEALVQSAMESTEITVWSLTMSDRRKPDEETPCPSLFITGGNPAVDGARRQLGSDTVREEIQRDRRIRSSVGSDRLRARNVMARARRRSRR